MKKLLFLVFQISICLGANAQTNIVFIESDNQSNQAVGAYGNLAMVTPNIDALASEGVSFMNAYNMGYWSPAVCIPNRTMLFMEKPWEVSNNKKVILYTKTGTIEYSNLEKYLRETTNLINSKNLNQL